MVVKYFWWGYFAPLVYCAWGQLPLLVTLLTLSCLEILLRTTIRSCF